MDGLSTYWVADGGPFRAVLMFRVGQADETLPTRGICHLVEHLAIEPQPRLYSSQRMVLDRRDRVLGRGRSRRGAGLPVGCGRGGCIRYRATGWSPSGRSSQRRAASGAGRSSLRSSAAAAGARTYGTASYEEFGLFRLGEDEAQAWADRYFVADNAVLFMTGEPSDGFSLELPRGARHTLPSAGRSPVCSFPPASALGEGGVGVGMEVERSPATGLALALLASAATNRLRHELGVTYHVGTDYQLAGPTKPTSRSRRTVSTQTPNGSRARCWRWSTTSRRTVPEKADLEHERERFRRAVRAPADALEWFATGDLIGVSREQLLEQVTSASEVSGDDVAAVVRGGADKMIMIVPSHVTLPTRCRPYPHFSERAVSGRRLRVKGLSGWLSARRAGMILGEEGLSAIYGDETVTTIEWKDCEVVLHWSNGTVMVIGRDGDRVPVPVETFGRDGAQAALDELKRHVPADHFVLMPDD